MAENVFGRTDAHGGAFSGEDVTVNFATEDGTTLVDRATGRAAGMLVQSIGVTYQQQASYLYELGSNLSYYVAGKSQGQASLQQVKGPSAIITGFLKKFGNVCNTGKNVLKLSVGGGFCGTGTAANLNVATSLTLRHCLAVNLGINQNVQSLLVNTNTGLMVGSLSMNEG